MKKPEMLVTFRGQTKPINEWAVQTGLPRYVLAKRLKAGWSEHDALTVPLLEQFRRGRARASQEAGA
jgi:hypothetical protein